jgi:AbrB family looped-hinge helix DNA binding protein
MATVTKSGRVTIPKQVQGYLQLRPGDRAEFVLEPDGRVVLLPATVDVAALEGNPRGPLRKCLRNGLRVPLRAFCCFDRLQALVG